MPGLFPFHPFFSKHASPFTTFIFPQRQQIAFSELLNGLVITLSALHLFSYLIVTIPPWDRNYHDLPIFQLRTLRPREVK